MAKKPPVRLPNLDRYLQAAGIARRVVNYQPSDVIFAQGERCRSVMFIQRGAVKISVLSPSGKEGVVAVLERGAFFGEGCLAGQPVRIATATAIAAATILVVPKQTMVRLLHSQHAFSDRFISHMLARNIRIEEDLVDHLFNSSEKRLARTLLLLARYSERQSTISVLPSMSQGVLAEMIGTTRSRVNFFMNKFRSLGFIDYSGSSLTIHSSLMSVVLHE